MRSIRLPRSLRLVSALALGTLSLSTTASAQTAPVDLDCSSGFECVVDSSITNQNTPHTYQWANSGGVTFTQFCPTSSNGGVAACGIRCISNRNGTITVTARDAYGLLIGQASRVIHCSAGF